MHRNRSGFTLIEFIVLMVIAVIVAIGFVVYQRVLHQVSAGRACNSSLGQIVKACTTYQEPSGDFFPAQSQYTTGTTDVFLPMPSLAMLYPEYVENPRIFRCPDTKDRPKITVKYLTGGLRMSPTTTVPVAPVSPSLKGPGPYRPYYSEGIRHVDFGPVSGNEKCSYFYDERQHFRDVGPGQAIACDADGMSWETPGPNGASGTKPTYPATWTRVPRKPNHEHGQNVMYFDGHVKWMETNYASDDHADNIFCPNGGAAAGSGQWGADTDAYLWDGVNARPVQLDTP